jgi:hypothetical protein
MAPNGAGLITYCGMLPYNPAIGAMKALAVLRMERIMGW